MVDLQTCTRTEFAKAFQQLSNENSKLIDYVKFLEEEKHDLNLKLQEYEGVDMSKDEKELEFQKFWKLYERKGNLKTARVRWNKLSKTKKDLIFDHLPKYVKSTYKDGRYPSRKNAEVYISKEGWNDEIVENKDCQRFSQPAVGHQSFVAFKPPERPKSTVDVSSKIAELKKQKKLKRG